METSNPYYLDLRIPQYLLSGYKSVQTNGQTQIDYQRLYNDLANRTSKNADIYLALGVMRVSGLGCLKNEAEAYMYFEAALNYGSNSASAAAAFNLYRMTLLSVGCKNLSVKGGAIDQRPLNYLKYAANHGYYYAHLYYGDALRYGDEKLGVKQNLTAARAMYGRSKNSVEDTACAFRYAEMCEKGEGGPIDYEEAKLWYDVSSGKDSNAAHNLGAMYYNGRGVEQDFSEALRYFEQAADLGDVVSMIDAGNICAWKLVEGIDDTKAIEYYVMAIMFGWKNDDLQSLLKKGNFTEERMAKLGASVFDFITDFGQDYFSGSNVIQQDYGKAFSIFELAAKYGDEKALLYLIQCYRKGLGVPKDQKRAFEMLIRLEKTGLQSERKDLQRFFYSQLGYCYYLGQGTKVNEAKGIQYLTKSADLGDIQAMLQIMPCYVDGKGGAPKNIPLAMQYANEILKNGSKSERAYAYYILGCCYVHGDKSIRNYELALLNCKKSLELDPLRQSAIDLRQQLSNDGNTLKPVSDLRKVFEDAAGNVFGAIFGAVIGGLLGAGGND